jgi:hydrogenase/urease accessory protein HupE
MPVPLFRKLFLFVITILLTLITGPVFAHDALLGGSKWCFGKDRILFTIELGSSLFPEIRGIKESGRDLDGLADEQLQEIAGIVQPYIDEKLSISINGKAHPVKVNKLVREGTLWKIWLSVDDIAFNNPENPVKIDYRLLFAETNNEHVNVAFLYMSDAAADAVQKVFDYSHPESQYSFQNNAPAWEFSIKGAARAGANSLTDGTAFTGSAGKNTSVPDKIINDPVQNGGIKNSSSSRKSAADNSAESPINSGGKENGLVSNKPAGMSVWTAAGQFISLGIKHILAGYDHIAFLLALIVIGLSFKEVLKIVTAFTAAHSITLLLAALQIVSLNSRFVEIVIALSICYVALENLFKKKVNYRWLVTFGFGLIHGFGFASVLQEFIAGKSNLVLSVLSFNIGVEIGQLMIFLVMMPVLYLLKSKFAFRNITAAASVAIFMMGFTWLVERVFNLKLLSF